MDYIKRMLSTQYRMHTSISEFPNIKLYDRSITNGEYVIHKEYTKDYLHGKYYGPYSFIDIEGHEERTDANFVNMVEATIAVNIVERLAQGISKDLVVK